MVELSHTVSHPRTVMVHPNYAPSANWTVVDSSFFYNIALKAVWRFVQWLDLLVADNSFFLILSPLLFLLWLPPRVSFEFFDLFPIINILCYGHYYCQVVGWAWLACGCSEIARTQNRHNDDENGNEEDEQGEILRWRLEYLLVEICCK